MSCITENTIIIPNSELKKFMEYIINNGRADSCKAIYDNEKYSLLIFDYNGEIYNYDYWNIKEYLIETNYGDGDGFALENTLSIEISVPERKDGYNGHIAQLILSNEGKKLFPEITTQKAQEIANRLEYSINGG